MVDQPKSPREKILSTNAYSHSAKRWLYIGVGIILAVMLGLWGYATITELSFFDWGGSREARLFRETKQEFDKIVNENPVLNEKVKERLELINQEKASSAVPPTTTFPKTETTTSTR